MAYQRINFFLPPNKARAKQAATWGWITGTIAALTWIDAIVNAAKHNVTVASVLGGFGLIIGCISAGFFYSVYIYNEYQLNELDHELYGGPQLVSYKPSIDGLLEPCGPER